MTHYNDLPRHMRDTARLYVEHGIPGGSFFTAVVSNDLCRAFACADEENTAAMRQWVMWLYNFAPEGCHGSPKNVSDWIAIGGLAGIEAKRADAAAHRARQMNAELPADQAEVLKLNGMI